jgi:dTDP-4-dehydrorhamnose 3,5-epimerase-like enzyme
VYHSSDKWQQGALLFIGRGKIWDFKTEGKMWENLCIFVFAVPRYFLHGAQQVEKNINFFAYLYNLCHDGADNA